MKKLKISDRAYELLLILVEDAFKNSSTHSIKEKELTDLLRELKILR